jgi:ribosome-binding factor A
MPSRRALKAAEAIREVVSMAILVDIKDPRVQDVTVTRVEMASDMRSAKIYVSVMGDEKKQTLSLRGLESSAGFLQSKVAKRIDTRYTPRLSFVVDQGVKKSLEVLRILKEVLPKEATAEEGQEAEAEETSPVDDGQYHDGDTMMDDVEEDSSDEEDSSKS